MHDGCVCNCACVCAGCYRLREVKEGSESCAVLHRMSSAQPSVTPQFAQLQVTSEYEYLNKHIPTTIVVQVQQSVWSVCVSVCLT